MTTKGLIGIGYEGRSIDAFLETLRESGVTTVVDVRLTPLSRKAGFSKRRLAEQLAAAGIAYVHLPALGNPRWNRAGFAGSPEQLRAAKAVCHDLYASTQADSALDRVRELSSTGTVALLCFESDQQRCHRSVVLEAIEARAMATIGADHLGG